MEQFEDRAKITTSIQVPMWLAQQIKAAGMTYSGAMVAGWLAIQERKGVDERFITMTRELNDTKANLNKYRDRWLQLLNEKTESEPRV